MLQLNVRQENGKNMKNLNKSELDKIYSNNKNLTDKPIFIDFYADW